MKALLLSASIALATLCHGQGFLDTYVEWPTPIGGQAPIAYSFHSWAFTPFDSQFAGSEAWQTMDMNGDRLPDLVVTGTWALGGGSTRQFGAGTAPYWKVHLNNGSGFEPTPITWQTPIGGTSVNGQARGFYNEWNEVYTFDYKDEWMLSDMDGDARVDLVVLGRSVQSTPGYTQFGFPATPYWKVYYNNGNGFDTTPSTFSTPVAGFLNPDETHHGLVLLGYPLYRAGSQKCGLQDLNNDQRLDLIIMGEGLSAEMGPPVQFGLDSQPFWRVHWNNGSGFETDPVVWNTPVFIPWDEPWEYGYISILNSDWRVQDITNDGAPDLVVNSVFVNGASRQHGIPDNPHWKVYSNNGTSFNSVATEWTTPSYPAANGSPSVYGFNTQFGSVADGLERWETFDLNGDGWYDLVLTSERPFLGSSDFSQFEPTGEKHWRAHLGTGTGFAPQPVQWSTPAGGAYDGIILLGHNATSNSLAEGISDIWITQDMNGDDKPDLVVMSTDGHQYGATTGDPHWRVYINPGFTPVPEAGAAPTSVVVFPNPAADVINIVSRTASNLDYHLYNAQGTRVSGGRLMGDRTTVPVSDLAPGVYTVHIENGTANGLRFVKE